MIKAVFFDIDGTLVSFKTHQVPQSTINAINELKRRGIKTFIATGRAFQQVPNLGNLTFDGYVTLNGGYCLTGDKQVMYKNAVNKQDIELLIKYQQEVEKFPCLFVTKDDMFINYKTDRVNEIEDLLKIDFNPVKDIEHARNEDIFQVVAFFGEGQEEKLMKEVFPNCDSTRWNPLFTDVVAHGNSKQVGIDKVLEYYGMELSECMSFGDGGNDIPMLKHTPISVAMGNAEDEVKQYATHITDSVDEDGIWNMLKKLEII